VPGKRAISATPPGADPRRSRCHYSSLQTTDFDELAEAFLRWNTRFRQLGRGPFEGELQLLQLGALQVVRVTANRMLHAEGAPPSGCFGCVPVLTTNQQAVWRGRRLAKGQTRVLVPGQEIDHVTSADYQALILQVDGDHFRKSASLLGGFDPEEQLAGREAVTADPTSLLACCSHLIALLDSATQRARLIAHPEAARQLEQECVGQFLGLIARARGEPPEVRPSNHIRLVRRAEEFLDVFLPQPLTMLDLCRELGASERALHYAFHEVRGLSPMAYVKAKRLNAVRQELRARAGVTVYEVAQRWGFWHTGEFAADYRRLFGELPSRTLEG
jgi:AraC family ethanolamine operon transcriptional activator